MKKFRSAQDKNIFNILNEVIDKSSDFFGVATPDGKAVFVNQAGREMLGIDLEGDISATVMFEYVHPDSMETFKTQLVEKAVLNGQSAAKVNLRHFLTNEAVPVDMRFFTMLDDDSGELKYFMSFGKSLSELNQQKEELKRRRDFFKNTIDNMPALFFAKDCDGKFLSVNRSFLELAETKESEILGKTDYELWPKEQAEIYIKNDQEVMQSKQSTTTEENAVWGDGRVRMYHSFKFPYLDDQGEVYAVGGIALDITESKALEKQALFNAKLASIGELAAGVGHEINNPLQIANGNMEILQLELKKESPNPQVIESLFAKYQDATNRIKNIVDGLRTFARADSGAIEKINLTKIVDGTVQLVSDLYLKEEIKISWDQKTANYFVDGNFSRIQQVVLNLLSNAKDAVSQLADKQIAIELVATEKNVLLKVSDNGKGIPEAVQPRIFDAFFTTKPIGEGTGIGLSLSASVIKEHNGKISFKTNSTGTTFSVELPRVYTEEKEAPQIGQEAGRELNVLVVDDESGVIEIIEYFLNEFFQSKVVTANDGEAALKLMTEEKFDLIITDLKMPKLSGQELIESIDTMELESYPKIILITGGTSVDVDSPEMKSLLRKVDGFLRKPYDSSQLVEIINNLFKP